MIRHPPYCPSRDLITETINVGLPLDTKRALTDAARRAGKPMSALVRDAVETVIDRDAALPSKPRAER